MDRVNLSTKQRFALYTLTKDEYTKSKLNDPEFAAVASKRLGFKVTRGHVGSARKDLEIVTNRPDNVPNSGGLASRVNQLERQFHALYVHLGWTPPKDATA